MTREEIVSLVNKGSVTQTGLLDSEKIKEESKDVFARHHITHPDVAEKFMNSEGGEDETPDVPPVVDPEPEEPEKTPEEYAAEVVSELMSGGNVKLSQDLVITTGKSLTLTKESTLDMDGHVVEVEKGGTYGDTVVIGNGANIVLSNGEIKPAGNSSQPNQSATIIVKTADASHLVLNNTKVTGYYPVYLNSANENSSVVINSGEYYTINPENPAVYVGKGSAGSTTGGNVTINGGTFGQPGVKYEYLCNVEDVLRKQEGKKPVDFITIKGGKFYNWNPENNAAEGAGTDFVAPGYKVGSYSKDDDTLYVVEKYDGDVDMDIDDDDNTIYWNNDKAKERLGIIDADKVADEVISVDPLNADNKE